jgi:hypothetical protein
MVLPRENIGAEQAKQISEESATISTLHVRTGTNLVTASFATNKSWKELVLIENGTGDAGIMALTQVLIQNNVLAATSAFAGIKIRIVVLTSFCECLEDHQGIDEGERLLASSIDDYGPAILVGAPKFNKTDAVLSFCRYWRQGCDLIPHKKTCPHGIESHPSVSASKQFL